MRGRLQAVAPRRVADQTIRCRRGLLQSIARNNLERRVVGHRDHGMVDGVWLVEKRDRYPKNSDRDHAARDHHAPVSLPARCGAQIHCRAIGRVARHIHDLTTGVGFLFFTGIYYPTRSLWFSTAPQSMGGQPAGLSAPVAPSCAVATPERLANQYRPRCSQAVRGGNTHRYGPIWHAVGAVNCSPFGTEDGTGVCDPLESPHHPTIEGVGSSAQGAAGGIS